MRTAGDEDREKLILPAEADGTSARTPRATAAPSSAHLAAIYAALAAVAVLSACAAAAAFLGASGGGATLQVQKQAYYRNRHVVQ